MRILMVGISTYQNALTLPGATNDIVALHPLLPEQADYRVLLNESASKKSVISGLQWLTEHDGMSYLHFSGHGYRDEEGEGIVAYDAPISEQELRSILVRRVVTVFDCCFSGGLTLSSKVQHNRLISNPCSIGFSSARSDEVAGDARFNGIPYGAYSYAFMRVLARGYAALTYGMLHDLIGVWMRQNKFVQTPQLDCPLHCRDWLFLKENVE